MTKLIAFVLLLPFLIASLSPAAEPVRVYILAGQSNMEGKGVVSYDDPKLYNGGKGNLIWSIENSQSKDLLKQLRTPDGKWVERDDVTIWYKVNDKVRQGKLTVGYTNFGGSSHIGPELGFGFVVGDATEAPVFLIKTAWGGKSLFADFRPPSATGGPGPNYTQMIAEVREALASLGDKPYVISGFVWQQGWNDMIDSKATVEYADNLVLLAQDLRAEFKSPALPMIIGELGNDGPAKPGSGMAKFREQQKLGASRIKNAVFVETHTFARPANLSPNVTHGHHWYGNAESYYLIGDALGKAAVKIMQDAKAE